MSKTYINAYTLDCALGNSEAVRRQNLQLKKSFSTLDFCFEEERLQLPYFTAFSQQHLAEQAIIKILEQHIFEVIEQAGWDQKSLPEIPIFLGSTSYSISASEQELLETPSETLEERCYQQTYSLNTLSNLLKEKHGCPAIFNMATSCTSSTHALLYAKELMDQGYFDRAIVLGFEISNLITTYGFLSLGLISQDALPFSPQSRGLVLGEGVSAIALSRSAGKLKSKLTLEGGATSCDTYNIATTTPDGENVVKVMQAALADAQITATEIKAVKAHATGSPVNDLAESKAIDTLLPQAGIILLKPYVGHTLGASGTIELALLIESLNHGYSPALPPLYTGNKLLSPHVLVESQPLQHGCYLLNSLGFGGSNVSLVLRYVP